MVEFKEVVTDVMIHDVANLAQTIWHEAYRDILSESQRVYMIETFQSERAIKQQIKEGMTYFLLFLHGSVAGYVGLGEEQGTLLLSKVYLLESMRGKGLFTEIIAFAKQQAQINQRDTLRLYVNKNNSALRVYKAKGFHVVSSVVKDIGHGYVMDDFCMELKIL